MKRVGALLAVALAAVLGWSAVGARAPGVDWTSHVEITPQGGYRMGNPAAPQKLVEYGSRTCPICKAADLDGRDAIKARVASGRMSFEFRDYPVHGAIDFAPIMLGRCVAPGRYFPMLHAMFDMQDDVWAKANAIPKAQTDALGKDILKISNFFGPRLGYVALAAKFGVPAAKAKACLSDPKAAKGILDRANAAAAQGVHGTPSFFLNGQQLSAIRWDGVEAVLAMSDRP